MRLNITGAVWDPFPQDMIGDWSLVETDSASLLAMDAQNGLPSVTLLSGGILKLTNPSPEAVAMEWCVCHASDYCVLCRLLLTGSHDAPCFDHISQATGARPNAPRHLPNVGRNI